MAKKFLNSLENKFCRVEHTDTHTHSVIYIDYIKGYKILDHLEPYCVTHSLKQKLKLTKMQMLFYA